MLSILTTHIHTKQRDTRKRVEGMDLFITMIVVMV